MNGACGLSCYTANLLAYLERLDGAALARMVGSIRTAVRVDLDDRLMFSHHGEALDRVAGGDRLAYAGVADAGEALARIRSEIERHGQVLVVADSAALPWSPATGGAPHWLLVDGSGDRRWHVVDRFEGLLPDGRQEAFDGWLDDAELTSVLVPPPALAQEQLDRNAMAFGHATELPAAGTFQWLERTAPPHPQPRLPGTWLHDEVAALGRLAGWFTEGPPQAGRHLDDVWAAARHQVFRLRWSRAQAPEAADVLDAAAEAWESLPQALRFALESARRGRPRHALVRQTFDRLAELQARVPAPAGTDAGQLKRPPA